MRTATGLGAPLPGGDYVGGGLGEGPRRGGAVRVGLQVDVGDVAFYSADAEDERLADLAAALARGDKPQHLHLACRQPVGRSAGGRGRALGPLVKRRQAGEEVVDGSQT